MRRAAAGMARPYPFAPVGTFSAVGLDHLCGSCESIARRQIVLRNRLQSEQGQVGACRGNGLNTGFRFLLFSHLLPARSLVLALRIGCAHRQRWLEALSKRTA